MSDLGYGNVVHYPNKVTASCECNPGKDNHSFVVLFSGKYPGYHCHRCRRRGMLADLIWSAYANGRHLVDSFMIMTGHQQADFGQPTKRKKLSEMEFDPCYFPGKNQAKERKERKTSFYHSVQLDLSGKVSMAAPPKIISERDYRRFKEGPSDYLLFRGFTAHTQNAYGVRLNDWSKRVVFPIREWDGTLKGFSQRLVWEKETCFKCGTSIIKDNGKMVHRCQECGKIYAKYMHSKGFRKK